MIPFLWEPVHKFKSMDSEFFLLTVPSWFPRLPWCILISPMGHINLKMGCGPWYQNAFFRKIMFKTFLFKYETYPGKWISIYRSSQPYGFSQWQHWLNHPPGMENCQHHRIPLVHVSQKLYPSSWLEQWGRKWWWTFLRWETQAKEIHLRKKIIISISITLY